MRRTALIFLLVNSGLVLSIGMAADASYDQFRLKAVWGSGGANQELKTWSYADLRKLKSTSSKEKDPESGRMAHWKGVLLQDVIDNALGDLPAERKAQIDLVILKNGAGKQALVPRAFVVKYPMLLAFERDNQSLGAQGPLFSVVPWSTKSKIQNEELPVESFFVSGVKQIEFGNYRERFSKLFLKRRTDPAAMRGEKLFVQSCMTCHSAGYGPSLTDASGTEKSRNLASVSHAKVKGAPKLSDRDKRALVNYIDAIRAENPSGIHVSSQ